MDAQTTAKKKGPLLSSWLFLNANGGKVILDVDKYVIMHRVGIHARDLRILDPLLSYPSTILGREKAIVLNLEHIKAIITATEVLLRNPSDDSVAPIVQELLRRLPITGYSQLSDHLGADGYDVNSSGDVPPFEFRALEVALEAICSFLDARTTELETAAYPALDELTKKISSRNLDRVRKLKSGMTRLTTRVQKVRDELEQLLDDDGDMSDLYLTRKSAGATSPPSGVPVSADNWVPVSPTIGSRISRGISRASTVSTYMHGTDDIEELEMLLEAYFMQIDGTLNRLTTVKSFAAFSLGGFVMVFLMGQLVQLREYIDDTEDYINIQLDNHRNQLIQLELILSSATVVTALYALVAGIFGMNLPYKWNTGYSYLFKWVVILTGVICLIVFSAVMSYARYKRLIG